jgi:hypothetical protein
MVKRHARELSTAFQDGLWPSIECPVCQSGVLAVPKKVDKPAEDDVPVEYRWAVNSYEDPMDIEGVFTMHLRCTKGSCAAVIAVSGDMFVDPNENYDTQDYSSQYGTFYRVRGFYPPVLVAEYTDDVPDEVVKQLRRVGALVWMDAPAAMTAVRSAVEALMTAQGVSATTQNGKFRNLDDRLDEFGRTEADLARFLRAAKWVGNQGTHTHAASDATPDDVLDMVEYVEIALKALYAPDHADALARADRIHQAKGLVP